MAGADLSTGMTNMLAQYLALQQLAQQGQHGDTMVAHLSPQEAQQLEDQGGAGTTNPTTGLPQYYDADPGELSGVSGVGASADDGAGNDWGGADPGELSGVSGVGTSGATDTSTPSPPSDFSAAEEAYNKRGFWDRLGGSVGGLFGLEEQRPDENNPASYAGGTWHTQFNPGTALGDVAGLALGARSRMGLPAAMLGGQLGRLAYRGLFGTPSSSTGTTGTDTTGLDPQSQKLYTLARLGLLRL